MRMAGEAIRSSSFGRLALASMTSRMAPMMRALVPEALAELERWIAGADQPEAITEYDWRRFQIEYRDYIDLAKLAQMIPVVGAPIGAFVNWRLLERLGNTAINGYRMRWLAR